MLAEDLFGAQSGELLHEAIPDDAAQLAVVDDDALCGIRHDVRGEVGLAMIAHGGLRLGLLARLARPRPPLSDAQESRAAIGQGEGDGDECGTDDDAYRHQRGGDGDSEDN